MTSTEPIYNTNYSQVSFCPSTLVDRLSCFLCGGLFRDALTAKECLHTFCKACIHKHFTTPPSTPNSELGSSTGTASLVSGVASSLASSNNSSGSSNRIHCPKCNLRFSDRLIVDAFRPDPILQALVQKCFPDAVKNDRKNEEEFYKKRGMPKKSSRRDLLQKNIISNNENSTGNLSSSNSSGNNAHIQQPQIGVILKPAPHPENSAFRHNGIIDVASQSMLTQNVRCPETTRIIDLLKYIYSLLPTKISEGRRPEELEMLCKTQVQGKEHTIAYIYGAFWNKQRGPFTLQYRFKHMDSMP